MWKMDVIYLDLLGAFHTSIKSAVDLFHFLATSMVALSGFSLVQRSIDDRHMYRR